jgi:UDPglucose--hexose-1-phosphate uridylyltransferase
MERTGRCLLCDILREERRDGRRIVAENDAFAAYLPFFARYPYEVHVTPTRHLQALTDMREDEQRALASILKTVLVAYDKLFNLSFPYMMVLHQRPCDGANYDHYHFHIEFYPPLRTATKLKYLAGSETGAGMYINDTLAEAKAAELREHVRPIVWQTEPAGETGDAGDARNGGGSGAGENPSSPPQQQEETSGD